VRSVRVRLALLFTLATAAILGAFATSLYLWVRASLDRELERRLETERRLFAAYFLEEHEEVRRGVHADLRSVLEGYSRASNARIGVRRADGTVLIPFPPGGRSVEERVRTPEGEGFVLTIGVSEELLEYQLGQLRRSYAIFGPLALLASFLLGYVFVGRALAPVAQIRHQAETISRANLSERVPVPAARGEFQDLARTFNEMLDRLDRGFQDLQNFAADAAHELRTPLANLQAEIDTAVQKSRTPEEYERILASIDEEVARMNRVVADLFVLAKIDMRQYALSRERVSLGRILEEARETCQHAADRRGIRIEFEGGDATAAGDPVALRRVFMNLVENAVKYNREGGRVRITLERSNGTIRVRVRDTGIGIPAEHLPKLFHRFYRVDKARSRETGGAGLGLAICKSFVEAHEGRIEVQSTPGEGTTFTVELPAAN
jgi:heavy metal sensor kinase